MVTDQKEFASGGCPFFGVQDAQVRPVQRTAFCVDKGHRIHRVLRNTVADPAAGNVWRERYDVPYVALTC
jgi:hypothetical protein